MEFRFDINQIFTEPIIRVNSNLLPHGFKGDRRVAVEMATKLSQIINDMGEASAKAQGLNKPVTTAQKLRLSNQNLYLLGDTSQGRFGAVIGLLKVGEKSLYVFDDNGETQMVNAPCVLDFYVHESRQRSGLGKNLFEVMLKEENYSPAKMAIDRPSDKLLGFLRKHYNLDRTIPQMNNFVIYDEFFDENNRQNKSTDLNNHQQKTSRMHITAGPNTALFGPQFISDECKRKSMKSQQQQLNSCPMIQTAPVGRYAAARPMGSMAEIIHSNATPATGEPNSYYHDGIRSERNSRHTANNNCCTSKHNHYQTVEADSVYMDSVQNNVDTITNQLDGLGIKNDNIPCRTLNGTDNHHHQRVEFNMNEMHGMTEQGPSLEVKEADEEDEEEDEQIQQQIQHEPKDKDHRQSHDIGIRIDDLDGAKEGSLKEVDEPVHIKKPTHFQYSKQHTGLKNISYNVGMAVSPTNKMEFDQEAPESFGIVKINRPIAGKTMTAHDNMDAASVASSTGSGEGYTDQGYFDLKFYHNKLW